MPNTYEATLDGIGQLLADRNVTGSGGEWLLEQVLRHGEWQFGHYGYNIKIKLEKNGRLRAYRCKPWI